MDFSDVEKYVAEMIATFTLTLAVLLSLLFEFSIPTPLVAGAVVGLFVYTIGPISGAHINPAVTAGMWAIKKIGDKQALAYIAAQVIGAGLASLAVLSMAATLPVINVYTTAEVALAEAVGAFLLVFGVASVATKTVTQGTSGIVVGGSLSIGIMIASTVSNGILNPAVAFGIGSLSLMYATAPIVGGVLGALTYVWMRGK